MSLDRAPLKLRINLLNGATSLDSLPWSDRRYYREGFRGGGAPDEHGEDAAVSAPEEVVLGNADYDKALGMYADALDASRVKAGLEPLGDTEVEEYLPDMSDLGEAPASPAPAGAGVLALADTVIAPTGVVELRTPLL